MNIDMHYYGVYALARAAGLTARVAEMIASHVEHAGAEYELELMGIAAHVYADTFVHYRFSGVSSRKNEVEGKSLQFPGGRDPLEDEYKQNFVGRFGRLLDLGNIRAGLAGVAAAATGALGHGAVFTYPDTPYLHWGYERKATGEYVDRVNLEDYAEACREIQARFSDFAGRCGPEHRDGDSARSFAPFAPSRPPARFAFVAGRRPWGPGRCLVAPRARFPASTR